MKVLVTGCAGFIGGHVVERLLADGHTVLGVDSLTYAGDRELMETFSSRHDKFKFMNWNIGGLRPNHLAGVDIVVNLAAESHVDNSIEDSSVFIQTNVVETHTFIEVCRKCDIPFLHFSTDEVYGDIANNNDLFTEKSPYAPSSPYSASKAASDHLVSSYVRTYKIPAIITNCSNNYGPKQHPEKLIPKLIYNILNNKPLPIYGRGTNSREWIYVKDHCEALFKVFKKGKNGQFYNIGSNKNLNNLQVSQKLIKVSKNSIKLKDKVKIIFVKDRPGHDIWYALNSNKIKNKLGWLPRTNFEQGIKLTFDWYNKNKAYYRSLSKKDIVKRLGKG